QSCSFCLFVLSFNTSIIGLYSIIKVSCLIIADHTYFNGEQLSRVDIAWLPLLYRSHLIEKHSKIDFLAQYPKVKAWQKAILSLGIAEKSVSSDFEQVFTDFYLSTSYLAK
ncbi:MAG: glutathione S-transferase domain-containing protein, partial [Colwellia sp.]|nr:glutathione S-transferase domain-containing protein [Colwellia sp.]MCW8865066.1 glutathione S-transferase domain-containing protein [Colwellia sp.]MCW9080564.1 glutathione S-transferase domain-containing protein [Colwellia sp.]